MPGSMVVEVIGIALPGVDYLSKHLLGTLAQ
ncbi:enoyl-CoA hydratase [Mycobacterium heckeshornense]|nr:enoyl-CoA hydratase [Mycobacterium heckeshornense]